MEKQDLVHHNTNRRNRLCFHRDDGRISLAAGRSYMDRPEDIVGEVVVLDQELDMSFVEEVLLQ